MLLVLKQVVSQEVRFKMYSQDFSSLRMTNMVFLVFTVYSVLLLTCTPGTTRASYDCFAQLEAKKNHLHVAQAL